MRRVLRFSLSRRTLAALAVLVAVGAGSAAWAYLSPGASSGANGAARAGSVNRATGLGLDGGVTPTANPDVALRWDAATLASGDPVTGYRITRLDAADRAQTTGASCAGDVSGTSCVESGVPDGAWTYRIEARDHRWLGPESASLDVLVDTSAPAIAHEPTSPSADASPSFSFSHAVYSSFECSLDGGAFAACASPKTYADVGDGPHTFAVEALDAGGHATQRASYAWTVDAGAPSLGAKPGTASADPAPSFAFSHATYDAFECRLDGGPFEPCASPKSYAGLGDGSHALQVRALDGDGVATAAAAYAWTVDTSAPTIAGKPAAASANPSPSFAFGHAQASYTFLCSVDGSAFAACASPLAPGPLGDGPHSVAIEAVDGDGVVAPNTASYDWTIDTTPPSIAGRPAATSANASPSFGFDHAQASYTFRCELDGGGYASCSSPSSLDGLADGSHTFRVEAVDADGVATPAAAATWTVDTSAPSIVDKPAKASANPEPSLAFRHDAASYTFLCKLDGYPFEACTSPTGDVLADGSHTFVVEAVDADGFVDPNAASYTWTIDTTPPSIDSHPSSPSANPNPTFAFGHEEASYTLECALEGAAYAPCGSPKTLAGVGDGSTFFSVEAVDADGIATPAAYFLWTVDTAAPSIVTKPAGQTRSTSASLGFADASYTSFQCRLDGGDGGDCTSPVGYDSLADGSHVFQLKALDADGVATEVGSYTWLVDTTKPAQSLALGGTISHVYLAGSGDAWTLYFQNGNGADGSFRLVDTASDTGSGVASVVFPGNGTGSYWAATGASSCPASPCTSNAYSYTTSGGHAAGTPNAETIAATDAVGNVDSLTLTFAPDTTAPSASVSVPGFVPQGTGVPVTFGGTDSGSGIDPGTGLLQRRSAAYNTTTRTCGSFGGWAQVGPTGLGSPYADASVASNTCYQYQYRVGDHLGNQSSFAASGSVVVAAPTAPAITSGSSTTFAVGSAGSFGVATTGLPTPTLANAAFAGCTPSASLPGSVTFADNGNGTATIAGTPTSDSAGKAYTLCVAASNGTSPDARQTFALNVQPTLHVSALGATRQTGGNWNATATTTVVDQSGTPVGGASVSGTWSRTGSGSSTACTTNASGQCSTSTGWIGTSYSSATWTVTGLAKSGFTYDASANAVHVVTIQRSDGSISTSGFGSPLYPAVLGLLLAASFGLRLARRRRRRSPGRR
jgi:hypothetical protein